MSNISSLIEFEEEKSSSLLARAIFLLWILMFIMSGIAFSVYYGAQDKIRMMYMRTLLGVQAEIFLIQAISGILWFIVSAYIFYSALFIEKREKYNIASGVLFLVSGVAELILSIYFLMIRQELLEIEQKLPLYEFTELLDKITSINDRLLPLVNISNIVISLSIGGAFILIGLSVINFANNILKNVELAMPLASIPQAFGTTSMVEGQTQQPQSYSSIALYNALDWMRSGANTMKNGGILYVLSGLLDFISLLAPGLTTISFLLFIVGAFVIGSGRKKVENARRVLLQLSQQESLKMERKEEFIGGDENVGE